MRSVESGTDRDGMGCGLQVLGPGSDQQYAARVMNTLFAKLSAALLIIVALMGSVFFAVDRINTRRFWKKQPLPVLLAL